MNPFIVATTLIALSLLLNSQLTQLSLDKRAVADTQRTLASELDAELPRLSFANWFEKVVGSRTGTIWQLSECGERIETAPNRDVDARACVEVNTILSDGRRVIVMIAVGTFKKGVTGAPAFHFGVIERKGELQPIRRLGDLPKLLSLPWNEAYRPAVRLPDVNLPKVKLVTIGAPVAGPLTPNDGEFGLLASIEESPPAPRARPAPPTAGPAAEIIEPMPEGLKVLGSVKWGGVIKRAQPRYPSGAKRYNISGGVDVQVTISASGSVIEAKAISGHPLLRGAAEEAARQWVFKPATLKGVPTETLVVLTFIFKVPQ
jgi:TonB family protein